MEIVTFVIDGRAEVGPSETKEVDSLACVELNKKADEMASTMEREIRRLMLPAGGITVQADLWFRPGASVIIEGSVILLCWVGRTALEPIRDELANAIKTVTRRVLNRAVSALSNLPPLPTCASMLRRSMWRRFRRRDSIRPSLRRQLRQRSKQRGQPFRINDG